MIRYVYKTRPYEHQVKALKKILRNDWGGALLMEPRTGKTKVAIDFMAIKWQLKRIDRVFIIAPKFVAAVWEEELATHFPGDDYEVYLWDQIERRRHFDIPQPLSDKLLIVITNFEAFGTPGRRTKSGRRGTKTGRIKNRNTVRRWAESGSTLGIIDESHRIKSAGAACSRTITTTRDSFTHRVMMTGTLITKASRAHDAYVQWRWLHPELFSEWPTLDDFKSYFGRWIKVKDVPVPLWKGNRNFIELMELIQKDAFRIARDQCFDLPPIDVQTIRVELSRSAEIYDDMATRMVSYIRQHTAEASIPLVKILRLAQITSGHVTTDKGEVIEVGREKLDATMPLVEQAIDNGERIILAARFRPDLDSLHSATRALSRSLPLYQIRGGMKRDQVQAELIAARKVSGPLVYIVQPRAGSLGIDMSFCSRMIWFSLTNSFVDYTQMCDRIALSRTSTTFTYMTAGGIDDLLYETLQEDGQVARAVARNPERLYRR